MRRYHLILAVVVLAFFLPNCADERQEEARRLVAELTEYSTFRAGTMDIPALMDQIRALGDDAIPALIEALEDENSHQKTLVVGLLAERGPSAKRGIPILINLLEIQFAPLQLKTIEALEAIAPKDKRVKEGLVDNILADDHEVRIEIAGMLFKYHRSDKDIIPALIKGMRYKEGWNDHVYNKCFEELSGMLNKIGKPAVPFLVDAFTEEDLSIVKAAVVTLGKIGPDADPAVERLIEFLSHEDTELRQAAASALGDIGPPPGVAATLYGTLLNGDHDLRKASAESLRHLGPEGWERLIEALAKVGRMKRISKFAMLELKKVEDLDTLLPMLMRGLRNSNSYIATNAGLVLREFGPKAKSVVPELIKALDGNTAIDISKAARILGDIGPEPGVIEALVRTLRNDKEKSSVVALSLIDIGTDAIPNILPLFDDADPHFRTKAAYIAGEIGTDTTVIDPLIKLLDDPVYNPRLYAVFALKKFGVDAETALPKLRLIAETDPYQDEKGEYLIRNNAKIAIEAIENAVGVK